MAVNRSTFTQAGLRDRVKGDLGLRSTNLLTDADLTAWANEGQALLAHEAHWYRRNNPADPIDVVLDQQEYDLPTDCIAVELVYHDGLPLRRIDIGGLFNMNPLWRTDGSATPLYYYLRGTTAIGLYPKPDANLTDGLQVIYTALPANPTNDADFYYLPPACQDVLVDYCCLRACLKDSAGEGRAKIDFYQGRFEAGKRRFMRYVREMSEGLPLVLGENSWPTEDAWWDVFHGQAIPAPP